MKSSASGSSYSSYSTYDGVGTSSGSFSSSYSTSSTISDRSTTKVYRSCLISPTLEDLLKTSRSSLAASVLFPRPKNLSASIFLREP